MDKRNNSLNPFPRMEEDVLVFWEKNKTFVRSVEKVAPRGDYVFYDGPPFGTGEPHYGHILSSIAKDVVPRYWTMRGFRIERRWGWDCHGLPIENIIEKDLGISGKKQIEEMGIGEFNEACRTRVLEYADIWDKMVRRIGRWVDFKNSYKTMDLPFMESVWWGFKELWGKGLIYQGRKVLLYCPRCETPISNFEVAMDNSYKDITETSVYVKFKVTSDKFQVNGDVYILAWTTTPWTLPGNVALAVGDDIDYVMVKADNEYLIVAKDRLEVINSGYEAIKELKGKDLVGLEYEPLFDVPAIKASGKKAHYIADADFVTTKDGTGVVHTAVVYGEDDYNLGLKLDLPVVPALDDKGIFNNNAPQFKGIYFKKANKLIIEDLDKRGLLFKIKDISHSYPHCHRCETQLYYSAIPAWFIAIAKLKKKMLEQNENISWFPEFLKYGRFALGIEQAPDWNISRNRYFATPIPIWQCDKCEEKKVVGSVSELQSDSGRFGITDIHRHFIDDITWTCPKCGGTMRRIREVLDGWVESGSMSFAQMHYPFENKEKFEKNFPAQYISEYISQTRAWFYVMHVMSTALFDSNSFEHVITTGVILNEKGEKMSKSKKNFPDPWKVINESGVDALRMYLMSSSLMHAENLFFNERDLRDVFRKNIMILWNVYSFYAMYARTAGDKPEAWDKASENILDRWIITRLGRLISDVTKSMDGYDIPKATRPITFFIDDLSTWYLRRSRERFKGEDEKDKAAALATTGFVLANLAKLMAPFMPFMAEQIWQKVTGNDFKNPDRSVHLEEWPEARNMQHETRNMVLTEMESVRKIVELALAKRDEAGIKVRQPLAKLEVRSKKLEDDYVKLIADEMNIKVVKFTGEKGELSVELDTEITDELRREGMKREVVRAVNSLRKEAGLSINDRIIITWSGGGEIGKAMSDYEKEILKETLADKLEMSDKENGKELAISGEKFRLAIRKLGN